MFVYHHDEPRCTKKKLSELSKLYEGDDLNYQKMSAIIRGVSGYRLDPDVMNEDELVKHYCESVYYLKTTGRIA